MKLVKALTRYHGVPLLLAGMGMTLGYAPFNAWPIALVCLAYWVWAVREASGIKQALKATAIWGFGWQISALYWLPRAFYLDAGGDWVVGILGGVPAMLAVAGWGVLGLLALTVGTRWAYKGGGKEAVNLTLPALWVTLEVIKGFHPMGFPWLPLGAMWSNWIWLAQGASIGSVYALSFVLVGLAVALSNPRWWKVNIPAVLVLTVLLGGAGMWRVEKPAAIPLEMIEQHYPLVRLVQPDEQSAAKWDPQYRWAYLQQVADLAFGPGYQAVDALLLPENAVPFYFEQEPQARAILTQRLMPQQVLATGTIGLDGDFETGQFYNRLSVLETTGEVGSFSNKVLIVPFGEYIPFHDILDALPIPAIRTISQSRKDYTAGTRAELLDLGRAGRAVPLVCYEAIFPLYVAKHTAGADFLLNVTNDNWFTGTIALAQHAALARLRAIETGLPMVRVANTGITVVYDGYGREITRLPTNVAAVKDIMLPEALKSTVWRRLWI